MTYILIQILQINTDFLAKGNIIKVIATIFQRTISLQILSYPLHQFQMIFPVSLLFIFIVYIFPTVLLLLIILFSLIYMILKTFIPFFHICRNCIANQRSTFEIESTIFFHCFFNASSALIFNVCKPFKLLCLPISHHSHFLYHTTALKLSCQLLLSALVRQILYKYGFTADWNAFLFIILRLSNFFSFCRSDVNVSRTDMLTIFLKGQIIVILVIKLDMAVSQTSSCILVLWQFNNNLFGS